MNKAFKNIVTLLLIISAIVLGIDMYRDFSVKNGEVGTVYSIEIKTNVEEVVKYDLQYIEFEPGETTLYESVYTYDPLNYDATKNTYKLTLNGVEITNQITTAGSITGDLIKKFYNINNEVDVTVTINFKITYTATGTTITITSNNTGNDLGYFNTYQNINGVILKLVKEI